MLFRGVERTAGGRCSVERGCSYTRDTARQAGGRRIQVSGRWRDGTCPPHCRQGPSACHLLFRSQRGRNRHFRPLMLRSPHAAEASFYVRGLSNHVRAPDLCSGVTFLRPLLLSLVQPFGVLSARGTCRGGDAAEGGCIGLWRWREGTGI